MTITDMIEKLQAMRDEHGNRPVTDVAGRRVDNILWDDEDSDGQVYITFGI